MTEKLEARAWGDRNPDIFSIRMNDQLIGNATKIGDKWLVFNKRKPVETLESAAVQCLERNISSLEKEIQKLRLMLSEVLS